LGLRFVPGVEISVSWLDQTLHMWSGWAIDPTNEALIAGLAQVAGWAGRAGGTYWRGT
jgi:predicted metal-dependent phosphoesterase TrpH